MKRTAVLAAFALALTACGGSTGVQDAGKPPNVQAPMQTVRLWFIKPGGRVGVERDLAPVTAQLRAYPDELVRLVLRQLERGQIGSSLYRAGFRTVLGCCAPAVSVRNGDVTVPHVLVRWHVNANVSAWSELAAAAQIQRTLAGLPGVRSVSVQGLSEGDVRHRLSSAIDSGAGRPVRRGSCLAARQAGSQPSVTITRVSATDVVAHVSAPMRVGIELDVDLSGEGGSAREALDASAAPCGIYDVSFSRGFTVAPGTAVADSRVLVRVAPLAGPAHPGVTRNLSTLLSSSA